MQTIALGQLKLPSGMTDIILAPKELKTGELMRPRALTLKPVAK